jgi:GNAT superfamily N-acetyltransferase
LLFDVRNLLSPKHPFHRHAVVRNFIATDDHGSVRGRISAIVNHAHNDFHKDKVGFFGFFDCVEDRGIAAALLQEAEKFLKDQGLDTVRGPMNFSTNEECGILVDGFDTPPVIMNTHNPRYYPALIESCGYAKAKDMYAYCMAEGQITDRVMEIGKKLEARMDVKFRKFDPKNFKAEVERFKIVYNQAWEDNWGFVPMTDAEIDVMAANLKMIVDPNLIFFAENQQGEPVGFILGLPDLNVLIKKINGRLFPFGIFTLLTQKKKINRARILAMGVLPNYRKRGIDTVMYYKAYKVGTEAGYNWGEFSWVLEDNVLMNEAARTMGAVPYKTWRIYEKKLS